MKPENPFPWEYCGVDADYCGDFLCQHLDKPCDWWLMRMTAKEYEQHRDESYKDRYVTKDGREFLVPYWWDGETEDHIRVVHAGGLL